MSAHQVQFVCRMPNDKSALSWEDYAGHHHEDRARECWLSKKGGQLQWERESYQNAIFMRHEAFLSDDTKNRFQLMGPTLAGSLSTLRTSIGTCPEPYYSTQELHALDHKSRHHYVHVLRECTHIALQPRFDMENKVRGEPSLKAGGPAPNQDKVEEIATKNKANYTSVVAPSDRQFDNPGDARLFSRQTHEIHSPWNKSSTENGVKLNLSYSTSKISRSAFKHLNIANKFAEAPDSVHGYSSSSRRSPPDKTQHGYGHTLNAMSRQAQNYGAELDAPGGTYQFDLETLGSDQANGHYMEIGEPTRNIHFAPPSQSTNSISPRSRLYTPTSDIADEWTIDVHQDRKGKRKMEEQPTDPERAIATAEGTIALPIPHPHSAFADSVAQNESLIALSLGRPSVPLPEKAAFGSQETGLTKPMRQTRYAANELNADIGPKLNAYNISSHDDEEEKVKREIYSNTVPIWMEELAFWRGRRRVHGTWTLDEVESLTESHGSR